MVINFHQDNLKRTPLSTHNHHPSIMGQYPSIMDQRYSISSLNPEQLPSIQISANGCFSDCSTTSFPYQEKPHNVQDSLLWDQFGGAIDQQLPIFNRYTGIVWTTYIIVLLAIVASMLVVVGTEEGESGIYVVALVVTVAFGTIICQYHIIRRNQEADKAIADICAEYDSRFLEHGCSPEYRTKWVRFCKPKHAKAMRLVVFKPTTNATDP
jgi:hypothetical protein